MKDYRHSSHGARKPSTGKCRPSPPMLHAVSGIASQTGRGSISSGLLFNFDVYQIAVQPFARRRGKDDLCRMSL